MNTEEIKKERKSFIEFKNQYAKNKDIDGVNDWQDYLDLCDNNAYSNYELDNIYEDMILEYFIFKSETPKQ
jgi:hypothetical protein